MRKQFFWAIAAILFLHSAVGADEASAASANVTNGNLSHSQSLFSTSGSPLSASVTLYYSSLSAKAAPLGLGWSHNYEIALEDAGSGAKRFRQGERARLYTVSGTTYVSQDGDFSTLVNVAGSWLLTEQSGTSYHFDPSGKLTAITDRYGNTASFVYNGAKLSTVTDPAGRVTSFFYDVATNNLSSISDPQGNSYSFSYNGNQLQSVTNPGDNGAWGYTYDADGFLLTKTDPNRQTITYTYDAQHRVKTSTDPEHQTRTYNYPDTTAAVRSTTLIEKDQGPWIYTYDTTAGTLTSKTDPAGKATSYTYYANGDMKSKTVPADDGKRFTTFYSYDGFGNTLTQTDPVDLNSWNPPIDPATVADPATLATLTPPIKPAVRYSYDHANQDRILSMSDERGATPLTTTYTYTTEDGGEVITVSAPGNVTTVTKHNPNGTIKETSDGNHKSTTYSYYPDTPENRTAGIVGLLQSVAGPDGVISSVTSYDKNGNPLESKVYDTAGVVRVTSTQVYDALNRLTKTTQTTANLPPIVTSYGYDHLGNRKSVKDAETRETKYDYNYNRQVTKITDALLHDTIFKYSGAGCASCGGGVDKLTEVRNAKQSADPSKQGTSYKYDILGRLQRETDPLGKKLHYTYYDSGLLKEKFDATGVADDQPGTLLVSYTYNERGQVLTKRRNDGSKDVFTYTPNGQIETAISYKTDGNTVLIGYTYEWYANGWLKSVTDSNNRTISYDEYDGIGQHKHVTYFPGTPDERVVTYDYDNNRPSHIYAPAGTFTYHYDELGRRDTLSYPNGIVASYGYDALDRLTGITHQVTSGPVIAAVTYPELDAVGNRKKRSNAELEQYVYDEIYRLLTVSSSKPEAFIYDVVGNRLSGPGAKDTGYVHDDANRMTQGRKLSYGYNNAGNQETRTVVSAIDKSWTQSWDVENRLQMVEKKKEYRDANGTLLKTDRRTITFGYDPFGRRIGKQFTSVIDNVTKTSTWSYVYDNDNIALEIFSDDGATTTKTFYTHGLGVDEHLALERNVQFYYYHADGLGSIVSITDASRNVVQSYEYDSFGMAKPATAFANSYNYTGREWDKETGLYYYRARYYDPIDGRFISKDPIGFAGGDVNMYGYVGNSPNNKIDPEGKYWQIPVAAGIMVCGGYLLYENSETFRGVVDSIAAYTLPDSGINSIGTAALNPDTFTTTVLIKVARFNEEQTDKGCGELIDPCWAQKYPYKALEKMEELKQQKCCPNKN